MGKFFNDMLMQMKVLPNIHNRGHKSLEGARVKYNEIVRSQEEKQDRSEHSDGASEQQPESIVPINQIDRPRAVRRTHKGRTRKARNK